MTRPTIFAACVLIGSVLSAEAQNTPNIKERPPQELLTIDSGSIKVGIDKALGASITWLSSSGYQGNMVNIHDPGRLIQQSYYAGHRLDRQSEGQGSHWAPWAWNPIQGGGIRSWARVTEFEKLDPKTIYAETIPKLWDMPDEEAEARMKQWTRLEPDLANAIRVRCQLICQRKVGDQWGPAALRPQEMPALYFTRNFSRFKSYLGGGQWRDEPRTERRPWSQTEPALNAMACFNSQGQGIAIYSPTATERWNFGPHGAGNSSDPLDGTCSHLAPIAKVELGPQSTMTYRYWLITGTEAEITVSLETLIKNHSAEKIELSNP